MTRPSDVKCLTGKLENRNITTSISTPHRGLVTLLRPLRIAHLQERSSRDDKQQSKKRSVLQSLLDQQSIDVYHQETTTL